MTSLVDHFERVLGPVHTGWSVAPDGTKMPFQIVRFTGGSDTDSVGYATLGLSRHQMSSPTSGRDIRQELFMLAPESLAPDPVVSLILQVGSMALRGKRALLRGNVIGPAGAIVPQSMMTALYVASPVYFPDAFATFAGPDGATVVAWLVPITTHEADFISGQGWAAFEDQLAAQDPDLVDFHRAEMSL